MFLKRYNLPTRNSNTLVRPPFVTTIRKRSNIGTVRKRKLWLHGNFIARRWMSRNDSSPRRVTLTVCSQGFRIFSNFRISELFLQQQPQTLLKREDFLILTTLATSVNITVQGQSFDMYMLFVFCRWKHKAIKRQKTASNLTGSKT